MYFGWNGSCKAAGYPGGLWVLLVYIGRVAFPMWGRVLVVVLGVCPVHLLRSLGVRYPDLLVIFRFPFPIELLLGFGQGGSCAEAG